MSEPLTAKGGTARVTFVGNVRPLFRLLARDATLESGEAQLLGVPFRDAVVTGVAGLALSDPPLPAEWTPQRYLLESARLSGLAEAEARRQTAAVIARFELAPYVHRRFADTVVAVKRVVLLAHAMLGSPRVLCVETPFVHLDPSSLAYVAAALEQAASGRHLVASVTSATDGERSLVERADWVVVAQGGRFVREGTPDLALEPSSRYAATVTRAADAFVAALAERGLRVTPADVAPALLGFVPENAAEVRRVLVELPSGSSPDEIVRAANRVGSPLVELAPL